MPRTANPFVRVPHMRNPALWSVSALARGIALELFVASCANTTGFEPAPLAVHGDWRVSLCKLLQVDSHERANVCRILDRLAAVGVLSIDGNFVSVHYHPPSYVPPIQPGSGGSPRPVRDQSAGSPSLVRRQSVASPSLVRTDLSVGNNSTPISQIDREIDRERENAHEDEHGNGVTAGLQGQGEVKPPSDQGQADVKPLASRRNDESTLGSEPWLRLARHFAALHDELEEGRRDARPAYDLQSVHRHYRSFAALLERSRTHSRLTGLPVPDVFEHAARRFLADPQQRAKGHVLAFFERDFARWCDGLRVVAS